MFANRRPVLATTTTKATLAIAASAAAAILSTLPAAASAANLPPLPPEIDLGLPSPIGDLEFPGAIVRYRQPYTPPASPFASRVKGCGNPVATDYVAFDDFGFGQSGTLLGVRWWGVIFDRDQIGRPYYVAIYSDVDCHPGDLLLEACVVPQNQVTASDCNDGHVCGAFAPLPPFPIAAGQRYWLQISEDDEASANPGFDDFAWSGRQPVRGCRALQSKGGTEFQALADACNGQRDDLSFEVFITVP